MTRHARKGRKKVNARLKLDSENGGVGVLERADEGGQFVAQHAPHAAAEQHHSHTHWPGSEHDSMERADLAQLAAQRAVIHDDGSAERLVDEAMAMEDRAMRDVERAMRDAQ